MSLENLTEDECRRFESRFDKVPGRCWTWKGTRNHGGYGVFCMRKTWFIASRVAYAMFVEPIPIGMCVLHRCDNPPCVSPEHLFLGTHTDNMIDMMSKGRRRHAEVSGLMGRRRFTEADARAVLASSQTDLELSRIFGVSQNVIRTLRSGKSWRHLQRESRVGEGSAAMSAA